MMGGHAKLRLHLLPWDPNKPFRSMLYCRQMCGLLAVAVFAAASTILGCGLSGDNDSGFAGAILNQLLLNCPRQPNGCGPAGILGDVVPECPVLPACFIDACNEHDGCYRRCGVERSVCDSTFHLGMLASCAETFSEDVQGLARSETVAFIYVEVTDR